MKFKEWNADIIAEPIMADNNRKCNTDCEQFSHYELVVQITEVIEGEDCLDSREYIDGGLLQTRFGWTQQYSTNEDWAWEQVEELADIVETLGNGNHTYVECDVLHD